MLVPDTGVSGTTLSSGDLAELVDRLADADGNAGDAELTRHATTAATGTGDPRSRGQLMADEFVLQIVEGNNQIQRRENHQTRHRHADTTGDDAPGRAWAPSPQASTWTSNSS